MNTEAQAALKAARRAKKCGKKEKGAQVKAPMIVHRPPIERKEVSRKLYDRMIQKSLASSVGAAFSFVWPLFVFFKRLLVNNRIY